MQRRSALGRISVPLALAIVLGVFGYGGCSGGGTAREPDGVPESPPTQQPAPEGESIELRLDQPKEVDGLVVTWTSVEDSRCPQGAMCVWAGEAVVRLRVKDSSADSEITLKLGSDAADAVLNSSHHAIRLIAVEPYPRHDAEVAREERRASIKVTRH